MLTVAEQLERLEQEQRASETRLALKRQVLESLPGNMSGFTLSNENIRYFGEPGAYLSFSGPAYDPEGKFSAVAVLEGLEQSGFIPMPITLCKWNNYRRHPEPGLQEMIPESKGRGYTLTDSEPIVPLWIVPNQYTGTEAETFFRSGERIFRVSVKTRAQVSIHARRKEILSGWYFERGTARLSFPESMRILFAGDEPVAEISAHSAAYVDTDQGISGAAYWTPYTEQSDFPLTPSAMLRLLESAK